MCHLPMPPSQKIHRKGRTLTKGSGLLFTGSAVAHAGPCLPSPGRQRSPLPLSFWWGLSAPGDAQRKEASGRYPPTRPLTLGADEAPFPAACFPRGLGPLPPTPPFPVTWCGAGGGGGWCRWLAVGGGGHQKLQKQHLLLLEQGCCSRNTLWAACRSKGAFSHSAGTARAQRQLLR